MQPVHALASAGNFRVLITNHGLHSRRQWARSSVDGAVEARFDATPARAAEIDRMKCLMVEALEPFFDGPDESEAHEAMLVIVGVATNTPWEMEFSHPEIRAAIQQLVARNLTTARMQGS